MLVESTLKALAVNSFTKTIVKENALYEKYRYTHSWDTRRSAGWILRHAPLLRTNLFDAAKVPHQDSIQRSASRFIHPSAPRGPEDGVSSEEASAQETVDFRIRQRNGFGFLAVVSLANLPQRLPFARGPLAKEDSSIGHSRYYSLVFLCHTEDGRRSIGKRLVSEGKRRTSGDE